MFLLNLLRLFFFDSFKEGGPLSFISFPSFFLEIKINLYRLPLILWRFQNAFLYQFQMFFFSNGQTLRFIHYFKF